MDETEAQLWEVITNVLGRNEGRCLDDVEDRAAVRDDLFATLVQTFVFAD